MAKKIIWISICLALGTTGFLLYKNFNRLLAEALMKTFNSNIISDVYELKFEKLNVNPFEGSIQVSNVTLQPRKSPLKEYPYINSSFQFSSKHLALKNVEIFTLLKYHQLILERISIIKPEVELWLNGTQPILTPFKDSTAVEKPMEEKGKKTIDSFMLNGFELIDASIHVSDSEKKRELKIQNFNIALKGLAITQRPGRDMIRFSHVGLSVGPSTGRLQSGPIKQMSLQAYTLDIDSLDIKKDLDTIEFHFIDFHTDLRGLDVQTADSIFHITLQSGDLSYKQKLITLTEIIFKSNQTEAEQQKAFKYQHTNFTGSAHLLKMMNVNFDSLIRHRTLRIAEVAMHGVSVSLFKDKTKPIDKNKKPIYLGQTIKAIPLPIVVRHLTGTNLKLVNVERKPDSTYAKVTLDRATAEARNITNFPTSKTFDITAEAFIESKVKLEIALKFSYSQPQFIFEGHLQKFNLPDLNPLIQAYTPAKITEGTVDEITFSGIARHTEATGTMKFLYHALEIDMNLRKKARWKSSVIAFAANSALNSSNPASSDSPPRLVTFQVKRDMNKGFR